MKRISGIVKIVTEAAIAATIAICGMNTPVDAAECFDAEECFKTEECIDAAECLDSVEFMQEEENIDDDMPSSDMLGQTSEGKGYSFDDSTGTLTCKAGFPAKCPDTINPNAVKKVVIQSGVTSVEDRGFYRCENLTSVNISDTVSDLGKSSFAKCISLGTIGIPGSVKTVGDSAFYGCTNLTKVYLSNGVSTVGDCAFSQCTHLQNVTVPGSVQTIGFMVFSHCTDLSSLTISSGVTTIGRSAFSGCEGLVSVKLPDSISTIEESAFYDCSSLQSINIPYGITRIPMYGFYGCKSLQSISFPNSVVGLGHYSFAFCNSLKTIQGGAGIKEAGTQTFYYTGGGALPTVIHQGAGVGLKNYKWQNDARTVTYKNMPNNSKSTGPVKEPTDAADRYADVFTNRWYVNAVRYVTDKKLMSGTGAGKFAPDAPCTRAMFVQIIYNMEKNPGAGASPFYDVENGKWYTSAVSWAYATGITSGKAPGLFGPNDNVTRETVAQFLMNYAKKCGLDTLNRTDINKFPDNADISGWASGALSWANSYGIIGGYSNGNLAPRDYCTRAQIAQMIMNFRNAFGI